MLQRALPNIPETPTWSTSERPGARRLARPLMRFIHLEVAAGALLAVATLLAILWVNSPWAASYERLWNAPVELGIGSWHLEHAGHHLTLHALVNDGLMVVFFFVVGLEIKRELTTGHLVDRRAALVPAIAAIGGMVVPAALYVAMTWGSGLEGGWGIPMATDIAFALGVLSLVSKRVPSTLKVFLLTLAIVDDIGAILVIAIFYSAGVSFAWLAAGVVTVAAMLGVRRAGIRYTPTFVIAGVALWYFLLQSGVHATIAGVIAGVLTPAEAWSPRTGESLPVISDAQAARSVGLAVREAVPVTERFEALLHPFTAFVILPVFALANAGIEVSGSALASAASAPVTVGVVAGLVIGKCIGISVAALVACRLGIGPLPDGCTPRHIVGVSALAGIGFTVAMFVSELAFDDHHVVAQAKIGILVASIVAGGLGVCLLRSGRRAPAEPAELATLR